MNKDINNVQDKKTLLNYKLKAINTKIIKIIKKSKNNILDEFYIAYCHYISNKHLDERKKNIEYLLNVCVPVRNRFSYILDRFVSFLKKGSYDLSVSEQDTVYAMKYVVPAHYDELKSHNIIIMTKSFVDIVRKYISIQLSANGYFISNEHIMSRLNNLVYIIFEDLWVSSVVGFRHQHRVIQKLLSSITESQERTSQRLAEEIHNEVLQLLATVPVKLEIIDGLVEKDIKSTKKEIQHTKSLINNIVSSLRDLSGELSFFWTERKGLIFSVKNFIRRFEIIYKIPVNILLPNNFKEINGFQGLILFRVIQEALYNIGKHSKAKKAKIIFKKCDGMLLITIEDNGTGFNLQKTLEGAFFNDNLGLVFMKEKIKSLKGKIEIRSLIGKGTKIKIFIPYNSLTE